MRHGNLRRGSRESALVTAGEKDRRTVRDELPHHSRANAACRTDDEHPLSHAWSGVTPPQSQSPTVCSSRAAAAISRSFSMARV